MTMATPGKGRADFLDLGDWNAACWECGRKFKASELRRHWQGYYVCQRCYEPRHPQDFVRAIPDMQIPPWVQPRPTDTFAGVCFPNDRTAIAGFATAGCAIANFIDRSFDVTGN